MSRLSPSGQPLPLPVESSDFETFLTIPNVGVYIKSTRRVHRALRKIYTAIAENKDYVYTGPLFMLLVSELESELQKLNVIIEELESRPDSQVTTVNEKTDAVTQTDKQEVTDSFCNTTNTWTTPPTVNENSSQTENIVTLEVFSQTSEIYQVDHQRVLISYGESEHLCNITSLTLPSCLSPDSPAFELVGTEASPCEKSSNEGEGPSALLSTINYWIQCIRKWYPELLTRTYFLPPVHFNRVPYSVKNIAGQEVLVPEIPLDGQSQASSIGKRTKSRSYRHKPKKTMSIPNQSLNPKPIFDSDVRDDRALQRVLRYLHTLADNSEQKQGMMVISQLQFGNYLGEPCYAAAAKLLPRPNTLPGNFLQKHYDEGGFDILIIHQQHGLFTLEIKSVGENFGQLNKTEEEEDDIVLKKVKDAVKQLDKSEVELKHLTSDLKPVVRVTKILVLPNIKSTHLLRVLNKHTSDGEDLCQCLDVRNVDDAVKLCLLSDQLTYVNYNDLRFMGLWWQQLVSTSVTEPLMTSTVYEQLVARFCGPATTVEVYCVTLPRLAIRTLGEGVSETGERVARLVLFPDQVNILNQSPPRVFLTGPPGTGKTVVLILQGLTWLRRGHDVRIISTCDGGRAASIFIERHLKVMSTHSSRIHRHQYNFLKNREVKTAVRFLESLSQSGQVCVIVDEAIDHSQHFRKFCDRTFETFPGVHLWVASLHHEIRPFCLAEVKLTSPLRSPPVVVREVMEAEEIKIRKRVYDYTVNDVPVPTDGPKVLQIKHRDNQSGHTGKLPLDCVECGHQVASVLTELNVGQTGDGNGPPPLQYRDVLVLCDDYPTHDQEDKKGRVTSARGLVQGLCSCDVPVRLVKKGDEAAICDTAIGVGDQVTVAYWRDVLGLERKVVIVQNKHVEFSSERLHAMSRCTSQLVLIDWKPF